MKMAFWKKHFLGVSLIFAIIISLFLSIYTIANYKTNNTRTQIKIGQNNSFKREGNQLPNNIGPVPGEQEPSQHMAPPGGNMQAHSGTNQATGGNMQVPNGNMPSPNMNMQRGGTSTSSKYAHILTAYSVIFLALFIAAYYLFIRKKLKINAKNEKKLLFTLLCVGLLLRISLSTLMEGHNDINLFKSWAISAANGLSQFYTNARSSDYPPLYIYVLFLIGKISNLTLINPYFTLLLKLPSIIADIATSYLIYRLARKYLAMEISVLASAFYIFNPAIFIDSTFWGQVDSFFTLLVVLAIFLLSEKKVGFSSVLFTAAVLMKPQGIIFVPVLLFELVRERNLKSFLKVTVSALIIALVIILPFSSNQDPLWIFKLFSNTISEYPYASVNAFNFFSLLGANFTKNSATLFVFSYHTWGMIFIVMVTTFSWIIYIKGNSRKLASISALLQIVGVFTFSAGMHERYLFPAVALSILAFIYTGDRRLLFLSIGFSATSYANIYSVLFGAFSGMNQTTFSPMLVVTSLLNVLLFAYLVKVSFDVAFKKRIYEMKLEAKDL